MSEDISFRDRPINMDEKGRRKWIYAKNPKGKWFNKRAFFTIAWLAFFILAPIIKINGEPFMLLDIVNRKFIIFGAIFWAQDTFIMALLMLSFVFFILLFTVTFGRIWCGWACPQTIFLEMIFRKIEFLVEGDYKQRHQLDQASWSAQKIFKKLLKHGLFILMSIILTNIFLMWFTGPEKLIQIITDPIQAHLQGFVIMLLVSAVFYWIYSFFREQICTMVCPYGRMQGVLLDKKSIIVAYDYKRGEPRGTKEGGDCINCQQCISVCPTGIDIRNGAQLECINCTACIDACDQVMEKVSKPKGLIRFDSIEGIEKGHKSIWNTRNRAYSVVLAILLGFFIYTLFTRPDVETSILRVPGTLYQVSEDGQVSNVYNLKIVNKTHDKMNLHVKLVTPNGKIKQAIEKPIELGIHERAERVYIVEFPKSSLSHGKNSIEFGIYNDKGELIENVGVGFLAP
ncbi:MAG: cytochrome c oxidase accessory protein CcoG [Bacteroidales bacterium]|nr:cytochrome c oxidase accessory protein CcoG [Bacteroidales bacterium]